jgi:hypothetical protein
MVEPILHHPPDEVSQPLCLLRPHQPHISSIFSRSFTRFQNSYTLGRVGVHNVIVAVMLEIGNNQAATVATLQLKDFRSIPFGRGISGAEREDDVRLRDVVVSKPTSKRRTKMTKWRE